MAHAAAVGGFECCQKCVEEEDIFVGIGHEYPSVGKEIGPSWISLAAACFSMFLDVFLTFGKCFLDVCCQRVEYFLGRDISSTQFLASPAARPPGPGHQDAASFRFTTSLYSRVNFLAVSTSHILYSYFAPEVQIKVCCLIV